MNETIEIGDSVKRIDLENEDYEFDKELEILDINDGEFYYYKVVNEGTYGHNSYLRNLILVKKKVKIEKKTLSRKIIQDYRDMNGVGHVIKVKDVKASLKEFIDDITDDSITLPDVRYMKKRAKQIFGERLVE